MITLEINDGDFFAIILWNMFVGDLKLFFHFENKDLKSLHEQVLLFLGIHSESLVVQSEAFEPIPIPDWKHKKDWLMISRIVFMATRET